jgi:hypothetical protein
MLQGAIIGGIMGLLIYFFIYNAKDRKYQRIFNGLSKGDLKYAGLYHYASAKRFRNGFKFFDSYGALYLKGNTLFYKDDERKDPLSFDMNLCTVKEEPDWRMMKWFSVTTPVGEKYFFNSHKMGMLKANSDETVKGFQALSINSIHA